VKTKLINGKIHVQLRRLWTSLIAMAALVHPLVANASLARSNSETNNSDAKGPRPMTASELTTTLGGVIVTNQWEPAPNETSDNDNVQLYLRIDNSFFKSSFAYVIAYANDSKAGMYFVSTEAPDYTRHFYTRMRSWPLTNGSGRTFKVQTANHEGYWLLDWPEFDRQNVKVRGSLKVGRIKFHTLHETSSGISSYFSFATSDRIVNNPDFTYQNTEPYTESIDAIFSQCDGIDSKDTWNFRHYTEVNTVPDGCTNITAFAPNPDDLSCEDYIDVFDNITGNTHEYLHVFWVNSFRGWFYEDPGWRYFSGWCPGGNRDWVILITSMDALDTTNTMAHEFGHAFQCPGDFGSIPGACDDNGEDYALCHEGAMWNNRLYTYKDCKTINNNAWLLEDIN
jgi:hypothetical protein